MPYLRLFFYLILFLLGITSDLSGRRYYTYSSMRRRRKIEEGAYSSITGIVAKIRRFRATRKCKKFLSDKKTKLILSNSNVIFAYNLKSMNFVCLNAKKLEQTISVEWHEQPNSTWEDDSDNAMEFFFDTICASFSEKTTYEKLAQQIRSEFTYIKETRPKAVKINSGEEEVNQAKFININEANEEELAKLSGINIVTAKKILDRIKTKGEYSSIDEMFKEMKIKKHFQVQLNQFICAKPTGKQKPQNQNKTQEEIIITQDDNDDRIVDI